jgi:hypothetical protein
MMTKPLPGTKPKDQHYLLYKKKAKSLFAELQLYRIRLEAIKQIHFEKSGICKQCQEPFPCATRTLSERWASD